MQNWRNEIKICIVGQKTDTKKSRQISADKVQDEYEKHCCGLIDFRNIVATNRRGFKAYKQLLNYRLMYIVMH